MPYRYKTQFYRIPVMGEGDMLTEEQEWVQMSTIDNLLYTAMFGCRKAFLEEGAYSIEWSDEYHLECHLHIKPATDSGYSLLGIINSRMFMSMDDISVGTLYNDVKYYVYIEYENGLETDARNFSVKAYMTRQEESDFRMCLCEIDTHGDGIINTDVNKIYAKNILSHTMDTTNPHGRVQTQDCIDVLERITLKGRTMNGVEYRKATTAGNGDSIEVQFDSEPLFVTVYPEELGAGEIAWTINGNSVFISNSGMSGIQINIRADMK